MLTKLFGDDSPGPNNVDSIVLPFPYEGTVSYGGGTAKAPKVILDALENQVEFYDIELKKITCEKIGFYKAPIPPLAGTPKEVHEQIVNMTKAATNSHPDVFLVGLGGEHSVTYPFVRGLIESGRYPEFGVLQIDAHADLRNEWTGTKLSHACVMRRLRDDLNLNTTHVGIRAIGDDEPAYIEEKSIPIFFAPFDTSQIPSILESLPENIFITFDVDGLDPSIMPSTGTPVPGGLLWNDALKLLRSVFINKNVIGMDIVELAPIDNFHAPDFLTAQLLYKCLGYKFCMM